MPDIGFRVLRVDDSNYEDRRKNIGSYSQADLDFDVEITKSDRSDLDLLFEALPKFQLQYDAKINTLSGGEFDEHTVYSVNDGQLLACFEVDIPKSLVRALAAFRPRPSYVLVSERSLPDSAACTNFVEIFKQSADSRPASHSPHHLRCRPCNSSSRNTSTRPTPPDAVCNVFDSQPLQDGVSYIRDTGVRKPVFHDHEPVQDALFEDDNYEQATFDSRDADDDTGYRNADLLLDGERLLANVQNVQRRQNLEESPKLYADPAGAVELDVEMETGTGKTFVYTKDHVRAERRYGWSKFIIVVPSIAIREGVAKSLDMTNDYFYTSAATATRDTGRNCTPSSTIRRT